MSKADALAELALEGLEAIARLTKSTRDDQAVSVLKALRVFAATFLKARSGDVSIAAVKKALAGLRPSIATNDAAADTARAARFGRKER